MQLQKEMDGPLGLDHVGSDQDLISLKEVPVPSAK